MIKSLSRNLLFIFAVKSKPFIEELCIALVILCSLFHSSSCSQKIKLIEDILTRSPFWEFEELLNIISIATIRIVYSLEDIVILLVLASTQDMLWTDSLQREYLVLRLIMELLSLEVALVKSSQGIWRIDVHPTTILSRILEYQYMIETSNI